MMGMGGSGGYGPYGQMRYNPMGYGYPMGQAGIGGMMPQYPQQMIPGMAGPGMMLPGSGFQGYCIFVYNIPQEADESFLFELFKRFGTVSSIRVMRDQQMKSKGFGFANMLSLMEAQRAISALNGVEVCGKKLQVSFKK